MSKKLDVIIIGAGVIGCSIAYHLAKKGITSQIIEREAIGARASGKAWAVIEYPAYYLAFQGNPFGFWGMAGGETIAHWQSLFWSGYYGMSNLAMDILEKGKIDIEYGVAPITRLAMSEPAEAFIKHLMTFMKEHEYYEYEWLSAEDLKVIFPTINPEVRGGLSMPQAQVEPYKYTLGLGQAAEAMGAEIRSGDVVDLEKKGNKITAVKLSSGTRIEADEIVIAMGPWSNTAASWLGLDIPMTVVLDECLRVKPRKPLPLHSINAGVEILSRINGDVILASAEVESATHYFESKGRPDYDSTLREEVKIKNIEAALELLPALEGSDLIEQRGDLLAYGPDPIYHKPVMGRVPGYENGYVATRFGGLGIHQSVGAGETMADLIANGQAPVNNKHLLEYLSPT